SICTGMGAAPLVPSPATCGGAVSVVLGSDFEQLPTVTSATTPTAMVAREAMRTMWGSIGDPRPLAMTSRNRYARPEVRRAQQLGRYHLLDRIAFGGMAEIYRAKTFDGQGHAHLVAVKRVLAHLAEDDDF